jgi:hypothetical protein
MTNDITISKEQYIYSPYASALADKDLPTIIDLQIAMPNYVLDHI